MSIGTHRHLAASEFGFDRAAVVMIDPSPRPDSQRQRSAVKRQPSWHDQRRRVGAAGRGGSARFAGLLAEWAQAWKHGRVLLGASLYDPKHHVGIDDEAIAKERQQSTGGRLDVLLKDPEDDLMYEVEVMLGETDETHIIRTIEYWDNERRRCPYCRVSPNTARG